MTGRPHAGESALPARRFSVSPRLSQFGQAYGPLAAVTPGTPGGGYSVSYARGSASMDGDADVTSPQAECINL